MRYVLVLAVLAGVAQADPAPMSAEARAHFDRGTAYYETGDFAAAITELEAGRQLDPNPDFLYALGQAYRKQGDCTHAVESYLAFLATHPPDAEATRARENIKRCSPEPAEPVAAPPPPPIVHRAEPPPVVHREPDERAPFYTDVPGGVLAAGGLLGLGAGVTYFVLGERDARAANSAPTLARLQQLADSSDRDRTIGTVCTIAGGALAVGAVVRYVMVGRRASGVAVVPHASGASVVWSGRF